MTPCFDQSEAISHETAVAAWLLQVSPRAPKWSSKGDKLHHYLRYSSGVEFNANRTMRA